MRRSSSEKPLGQVCNPMADLVLAAKLMGFVPQRCSSGTFGKAGSLRHLTLGTHFQNLQNVAFGGMCLGVAGVRSVSLKPFPKNRHDPLFTM